MRVELLDYTGLKIAYLAARQCYYSGSVIDFKGTVSKKKQIKLLVRCILSGHLSVIEHLKYTFAIEGITRACSHQLVRHRIASFSQQSQRQVKLNSLKDWYLLPSSIVAEDLQLEVRQHLQKTATLYHKLVRQGIPKEDARSILPNATKTNLVMTMNGHSLLNLIEERCCTKSQKEIRTLVNFILKSLKVVQPGLYGLDRVGPKCEHLGYCPEAESCGRKPNKREETEDEI